MTTHRRATNIDDQNARNARYVYSDQDSKDQDN
jgi:hypothetical protein